MISKSADVITNFLLRKKIVKLKDKDIYKYGFELLISGTLNLVLAVLVGLMFGGILKAAIFFCIIVSVRIYSGGYHASSYLKCNLTYIMVYLTVVLVNNFLICQIVNNMFIILGDIFVILFMYIYAPVGHIRREIQKYEVSKFKQKSIRAVCFWNITGIIFWSVHTKDLAYFILTTLYAIVVLMVIALKVGDNERKAVNLNFE